MPKRIYHKKSLSQMFGVIPRNIRDEVNEPEPSQIRKITSVAQQHEISAIDHKGSDTKKYNVLKSKQSFDKKFHFPQEQFGKKTQWKTSHALIFYQLVR